ncbi:MAG TPA: AbrB/MazE/SpoVT family DNA-binding domain-containing protein [Tepidisphaeraceae bacterium]|jgi:AbrB family looped-hinge helix DNA binding protein|nr:AbrB/MazE/SpoVT family DNA-binding domain-containing protein [Tepidisphaeraceae bacterium]
MTVLVRKLGGSVAVVIPNAIAKEIGLKEGTPLDVTTEDATLLLRVRGRRPRRPIAKLVARIKPEHYKRHNRDLLEDKPVGKELW